jgi:membrane protein implicated in regulation of membrane protease activity
MWFKYRKFLNFRKVGSMLTVSIVAISIATLWGLVCCVMLVWFIRRVNDRVEAWSEPEKLQRRIEKMESTWKEVHEKMTKTDQRLRMREVRASKQQEQSEGEAESVDSAPSRSELRRQIAARLRA